MIYLMYVAVIVFAWFFCFKLASFNAGLVFHGLRGLRLATSADREGFVRVYSRVIKALGYLFAGVAVVFALTEYFG